jgi:MFS family permease
MRESYWGLFKIRGVSPLIGTMILSRLGANMWNLALVLFVLEQFHSPAITGLISFFGLTPGLLISPLAGVVLDRHGRKRWVALDLAVGVAIVACITILTFLHQLSPVPIILIVGIGSLTLPLSASGMRTLIPLLIPRPLWGRANALDSASGDATFLLGPVLAGVLFTILGGLATLQVIALLWLVGALLVFFVQEPHTKVQGKEPLWLSARQGMQYIIHSPTLRNLTWIMPLANLGTGVFLVALPVFVLGLPYGNSTLVGLLWSGFAGAGVISGLILGSLHTEGRERWLMALFVFIVGIGFLITALSSLTAIPLVIAAIGMIIAGLANGPLNVTMFSVRQQATNPDWLGRVIAISGSISLLGTPVGSALGGLGVSGSLVGTMAVVAVLTMVCALFYLAFLPVRIMPSDSLEEPRVAEDLSKGGKARG